MSSLGRSWPSCARRPTRPARPLEELVFALNDGGSAPPPWEPSFRLAEAGFRLYNKLLPSEDETALKVRRWLEDLRKQSG